jgi:hypothetical protein
LANPSSFIAANHQRLVVSEVYQNFEDIQPLQLRGGYPNSYLATQNDASWGWRMVAHLHGQMLGQFANELPSGATMSFYRTAADAERG